MKMSYAYMLFYICVPLASLLVNASGIVPNAGVQATDINPFNFTLFVTSGIIATLVGGLIFGFGGQIVALGLLISVIMGALNSFLGLPGIITSIGQNLIPSTDSMFVLFAGPAPILPLIFNSLTAFIFFFFFAEMVSGRNITY